MALFALIFRSHGNSVQKARSRACISTWLFVIIGTEGGYSTGDKIKSYLTQKEHDRNLETVNAIIEGCLVEDVLTDFLTSRREEVQTIITYLSDYETIMRNHDYQIERKAEQVGIAKGIEQGIQALVATVKKLSQNRDTAIEMVMEQFGLQKQAAADKVAQYWG